MLIRNLDNKFNNNINSIKNKKIPQSLYKKSVKEHPIKIIKIMQ